VVDSEGDERLRPVVAWAVVSDADVWSVVGIVTDPRNPTAFVRGDAIVDLEAGEVLSYRRIEPVVPDETDPELAEQ
jgi:hypothetical protein